ncbi:DUF6415 family natural product biosynthesis protein [Streptomyces sp. NPDC089919]|uniref:DUF6415 family natural product biosynthesis protein n=1 Tax=Streptomyces sp. NPDC089919 TaxID=3155188 RepID=UPI00342B9808
MSTTGGEGAEGVALVARALVPYGQKPGAEAIVGLTDALLRYGGGLLPAVAGLEPDDRLRGALKDWRTLTGRGPADEALGSWNFCRGVARTVRTFHQALGLPVPRPGAVAGSGPAQPDVRPVPGTGVPALRAAIAAHAPQLLAEFEADWRARVADTYDVDAAPGFLARWRDAYAAAATSPVP